MTNFKFFTLCFILLFSQPALGASEETAIEHWVNKLAKSKDIPKNKFQALYFNTDDLEEDPVREIVEQISIQNTQTKLNIPDNAFVGYWVGDFFFEEEETKELTIDQSWAHTYVTINNESVFDSDDEGLVDHTFQKGWNRIEVQHISNWHVASFAFGIRELIESKSENELFKSISDLYKVPKYYAVNLYESASADMTTDVVLNDIPKGAIILLNSYEPIHWNIINIDKYKPSIIAVSSYSYGSSVTTELPKQTELIYTTSSLEFYGAFDCSCHGQYFRCNDDGDTHVLELSDYLKEYTKGKIHGFSEDYSASRITLPQTKLTTEQRNRLEKEIKDRDDREKECKRSYKRAIKNATKRH